MSLPDAVCTNWRFRLMGVPTRTFLAMYPLSFANTPGVSNTCSRCSWDNTGQSDVTRAMRISSDRGRGLPVLSSVSLFVYDDVPAMAVAICRASSRWSVVSGWPLILRISASSTTGDRFNSRTFLAMAELRSDSSARFAIL